MKGVVRQEATATGAAAVLVHATSGENQICVGAGANLTVRASQLDASVLQDTSVLVLQARAPTPPPPLSNERAQRYDGGRGG